MVMSKNISWKDADGKQISDAELYEWIKSKNLGLTQDFKLIVGVDSHPSGGGYKFTTVVCVYHVGRGGFYYHSSIWADNREFLKGSHAARVKAKVFFETELALATAEKIFENTEILPIVHLDASLPEAGEVTSAFSDQLKGYVVASGFECVLKPWAFVASGIGNKHCRPDANTSHRRHRRIHFTQ